MDPQLVIALVGVGGTLAGVGLSQLLTWAADARRRKDERADRWHNRLQDLAGEILAAALKLEKSAWSSAAQLDRDQRDERLPGHRSILLTPDAGIPNVIDEITVVILRETIEDGYEGLDALEVLVETFVVVATPTAGAAARRLVECLWEAYGSLEAFERFDEAADNVERARSARDGFVNEVRRALGVSGRATADSRPRSGDPA